MRIPSGRSAWVGARLSYSNAQTHHRSAELLAEAGAYGQAIAHLVLASEEATKSIGYLLSGVGLPFTGKDKDRLLRHHQTRHVVAGLSQVLWDFVATSVSNQPLTSDNKLPSSSEILDLIHMLGGQWQSYLDQTPDEDLAADLQWWQNAERHKQMGTYVDPSPDGWTTPAAVMKADYERARAVTSRFLGDADRILRPWIEAEDEGFAAFIEWLGPMVQRLLHGEAADLAQLYLGAD